MKASICIATYNKPNELRNTLHSIFTQNPPFSYEVIVVDDGGSTKQTEQVCKGFPVDYIRLENPGYGNPAKARNVAYRRAKGEVIITQSDDVIHHTGNTIEELVNRLKPGTFVLATVVNVDKNGNPYSDKEGKGFGDYLETYVSPRRRRPLFFLGSLYKSDLYAVGGNDEDFVKPAGEDVWFSNCLVYGLGLTPIFLDSVVGRHQAHTHGDPKIAQISVRLREEKFRKAKKGLVPFCSSGGPWK